MVWLPNWKVLAGVEAGRSFSISSRVPQKSAWLGQTEAHQGLRPSEVRSWHISHFIIRLARESILGTPKGQASTQLLQEMQRGFRAVWTTPSAVRLIASAGQTSAQVGESQCMQTTGTVCGDCWRSIYSWWIID